MADLILDIKENSYHLHGILPNRGIDILQAFLVDADLGKALNPFGDDPADLVPASIEGYLREFQKLYGDQVRLTVCLPHEGGISDSDRKRLYAAFGMSEDLGQKLLGE